MFDGNRPASGYSLMMMMMRTIRDYYHKADVRRSIKLAKTIGDQQITYLSSNQWRHDCKNAPLL